MSSQQMISDFLAQRKLALIGVSRSGRRFGNAVWKELRAKDYQVFPVHPQASLIDGQSCWPNVLKLPEPVGGAVLVVPPSVTEEVVREIAQAGIPRVWMQQGSESAAAIAYCNEKGIGVVHGECILMFLEPTAFFHRAHRWIRQVLGKLPR
jgi:predicted CoA-binding protein